MSLRESQVTRQREDEPKQGFLISDGRYDA